MMMYDTIDRLVTSLQVAEAMCHVLFEVLGKDALRNPAATLVELRFIMRHFEPGDLVGHLATSGKTRNDSFGGSWLLQVAGVCADLRKQCQERVEWMTSVFHKWGGSPMPDGSAGGVDFVDVYIRVENKKVVQ